MGNVTQNAYSRKFQTREANGNENQKVLKCVPIIMPV